MMEKNIRYISVEQFAKFSGVKSSTVKKWIRYGFIKTLDVHKGEELKISLDNLAKVPLEKKEFRYPHSLALLEEQIEDHDKVLIVDDEESVIDSIEPYFSSNGFEVISSTNAYEAMIMMHETHPLIVTLDLKMLNSNGLDLLKMINDLGLNQDVWVIVISGASERELQNAVNYGADFYLQKPFSENDLSRLIKKLSSNPKQKKAA